MLTEKDKIRHFLPVLCLLLWMLANWIYLQGFLPVNTKLKRFSLTDKPDPMLMLLKQPMIERIRNEDEEKMILNRLVILLIDGLRTDHVSDDKMPFLKKLRSDGKAISFNAKVAAPTVTLPRIKALVTGKVPGFVDIILNFASSELEEDNFLTQFKNAKKNIVFYGDQIWQSLFPDTFLRSEGVHTFFVNDFYEGDKNTTKHLKEELTRTDWMALVLHYVGLDHIGHVYDSYSELIKPKLQEMDNVLNLTYSSLVHNYFNNGDFPLILMCGDHGMANAGGHGGLSVEEATTPLIFVSPHFNWSKANEPRFFNQIDVAPTISLLFDVPIPNGSIGTLIPELFQSWSFRSKRNAYLKNANQLLAVAPENSQNKLTSEKVKNEFKKLLEDTDQENPNAFEALDTLLKELSETLQSDSSTYYESLLLLAIVLGGISSCFAFSLLSHSIAVTNQQLFNKCANKYETNSGSRFLQWTGACKSSLAKTSSVRELGIPTSFVIIVVFYILATLSMASSSFVEEEHQVWYFLVTTTILVVLVDILFSIQDSNFTRTTKANLQGQAEVEDIYGTDTDSLLLHRYFTSEMLQSYKRHRNTSSGEVREQEDTLGRFTVTRVDFVWEQFLSKYLYPILGCVIFACLLRCARTWNQTGVKWLEQPDIGDWLVKNIYNGVLTICFVASLLINFVISFKTNSLESTVLFFIGEYFLYKYHSLNSHLNVVNPTSRTSGICYARCIFILAPLIVVVPSVLQKLLIFCGLKKEMHVDVDRPRILFIDDLLLSFKLIILLLSKVQNVILNSLVFVMEEILSSSLEKRARRNAYSSIEISIIYFFFAKAIFFAQGNSNSLSTVDVAAGLIGAKEYNPFIAGFLTTLTTFSGLILMCLSCIRWHARFSRNSTKDLWLKTIFVFLFMHDTNSLFYFFVAYVQRYHLFIWSVFAPKLLYNIMFSLVLYVLAFLTWPLLEK